MKYALVLIALLLPWKALAGSDARLVLSGTVADKIDYKLHYDQARGQWRLVQSTNGRLRASLVKNKNFSYTVSVRAP